MPLACGQPDSSEKICACSGLQAMDAMTIIGVHAKTVEERMAVRSGWQKGRACPSISGTFLLDGEVAPSFGRLVTAAPAGIAAAYIRPTSTSPCASDRSLSFGSS